MPSCGTDGAVAPHDVVVPRRWQRALPSGDCLKRFPGMKGYDALTLILGQTIKRQHSVLNCRRAITIMGEAYRSVEAG